MSTRVAWLVVAAAGHAAQLKAQSDPPRFTPTPNAVRLQSGLALGEVVGVAHTGLGGGRLYVLSRRAGPSAGRVFSFDNTGRYLSTMADDLFGWIFPRALRVDGDGNLWVVDQGAGVVVKLSPLGGVELVLGRRPPIAPDGLPWPMPPIPGGGQANGILGSPTDVAWDSVGNVFVTDGGPSGRVSKFDRSGTFVLSWELQRNVDGRPTRLQSVVVDSLDHVYAGDVEGQRIMVFSTDGTPLRGPIKVAGVIPPGARPWMGPVPSGSEAARLVGAPWAMCISPRPRQYLFVADAFPGQIYQMRLDGAIIETIGRSGRKAGEFGWVHGLSCDVDQRLYVADMLNWRVQRFDKSP
jgi:sugar lactone lactonase YvrE